MLTTIQELEQEIDQFHKNIKESNDLLKILMSVASLTKTQTESFDSRTTALQNELDKLSPELSNLFQKKIEVFVQEVHREQQLYLSAVEKLMEKYSKKIVAAETAITKVPDILDAQNEAAHKRHMEELTNAESSYSQTLISSMDRLVAKAEETIESVSGVPAELDTQLQKNRVGNAADLKKVQEQYAADLAKTNDTFSEKLRDAVDSIRTISVQIKDDSAQQYGVFLEELKKMMDDRLAQLSDTENRVVMLSQQLEEKYNAFVLKLEATNMDQLYKYCQNMNKSINTKLGIALGGVAIAVIVSIISLFI